ncbi:hypothetical protein C4J81_16190 [Deltaproteobacteria bacterium Smac51]|nr:hypothetical protein C4J81_16190 [Deltaproteobacteria bacterium Smac51]
MADKKHPHHHHHDHDILHQAAQHDHKHDHSHHHRHDQHHDQDILHHADRLYGELSKSAAYGSTLVIRPNSGISGDIIVAGLLALSGLDQDGLNSILGDLNLENLAGRVRLESRELDSISGVGLHVDLPHEHEHRTLADMEAFFEKSKISDKAKELALAAFRLLAEAEGAVHGLPPEKVHFHEVGALDSILDFGLAAALMDYLAPARIVCGPLPVCDGVIKCQHGLLPSPAPAVMRLLEGVPVVGLDSSGETVTPTGVALLKAFGAEFGLWPAISIVRHALVYGSRRLEGVPNGAIFVLGHWGGGLVRSASPSL